MARHGLVTRGAPAVLAVLLASPAGAQSFRVQCPGSTITHPLAVDNNTELAYAGPTQLTCSVPGGCTPSNNVGYLVPDVTNPSLHMNGAVKCQQVSGGDGYSTMADGTQTFMFSFGPLSGLADIANGLPGTEYPATFNAVAPFTLRPGDPATTDGASDSGAAYSAGTLGAFTYNGAVGLAPDPDAGGILDGHVDPRPIVDVGVMNGNIPAPLMAIDEDDEFFLTLSNVGMIMRPDLFEQHTIHFHGYPNASSFYDGVPDASVGINIGGSFTYYYLAPDAGTYFWHCHITPPEHLQMGMVGQLYVRPRQNRVAVGRSLYAALQTQQADLRTACRPGADILCSTNVPAVDTGATQVLEALGTAQTNPNLGLPRKYAYDDGDGSTGYDVEYPLQIHGFDPNFHFVGMTFNPEAFVDMKDKYFLLNGRSYPDTVSPGPQATQSSDGRVHYSQPLPSIINIPAGGKALLRISDLSVSEYATLASLGIPLHVVGYNAKLLRDQAGSNTDYYTNSITLAGGESADVIIDASNTALYPSGSVFYLYTPNLDHLSNDAENFGGMMTEVRVN